MKIDEILKNWQLNPGASEDAMRDAISSFGHPLPADYIQFCREHNGGEGFIGDNYLILWQIEELGPFNLEYEVEQYAPELFLFGSNGGGEGYGFDMRDTTMPVIRVPFIGMELRYARPIASSFTELFSELAR